MQTQKKTNSPIERLVYELVAKIACCQPQQIAARHELTRDLGLSSLDRLELLVEAERLFEVELSDQELASVRSVADLTYVFTKRLKA
jgi:acyl carrier protein